MNNIKLLMSSAAIISVFAFTIIKPIEWKIKEDYSVKFNAGGASGSFKGLKCTISFDDVSPEKSKIVATIDATTIEMGGARETAHAKSKEMLDAKKFPEITFVSTSIKKAELNNYEVTGDLTLKGITKKVKFPFVFNREKTIVRFPTSILKESFYGTLTISPRDFNMTERGMPDNVMIELMIPVTK